MTEKISRFLKALFPIWVDITDRVLFLLLKYLAFLEKGFRLCTRLRRTRGEKIYRSRRFGLFSREKKFFPSPRAIDPYREQRVFEKTAAFVLFSSDYRAFRMYF